MTKKFIAPLSAVAVLLATTAFGQPITNEITNDIANDLTIRNGDLIVRDGQNRLRTRIDSDSGDWRSVTPQGDTAVHVHQGGANIFVGGNGTGEDGDIVLFSDSAQNHNTSNASIHLDAGTGAQRLGGGGENGRLVLRAPNNDQRILLDGQNAQVIIGNDTRRGRLFVRNTAGENTAVINGANGRIRANQIVSRHNHSAPQNGIDTASIYVEGADPAIALRDTSGNSNAGWLVQSGSTGRLLFHTGTTSTLGDPVFVLEQDGSVCLGNCD